MTGDLPPGSQTLEETVDEFVARHAGGIGGKLKLPRRLGRDGERYPY